MEGRDPYRILQVDPSADPDVIKAAYRVLARKLHPDGKAHVEIEAEAAAAIDRQMADLNWAYGVLRDGTKRAAFDRGRRPAERAAERPAAAHRTPRTEQPRVPGDERLDFGRYEGWTLREVAKRDIEYLRWLSRHASGARHRRAIAELLAAKEPPMKTR